jgi:hypothetical protein
VFVAVDFKVEGMRAHKGWSSNHGPSGAIPWDSINSDSFLIADIAILIDGTRVGAFGGKGPMEYYADNFFWALHRAIRAMDGANSIRTRLAYSYDQGEPVIDFHREHERLRVFVYEEEAVDPDKEEHSCSYSEFREACVSGLLQVRKELIRNAGEKGALHYDCNILKEEGEKS